MSQSSAASSAAEIRPEDRAREENCKIFKALNSLRRYGLNPGKNSQSGQSGQSKKGEQKRWRRTWGTLVTNYGKREEARLHVAIRPFMHVRRANVLELLTKSMQRVGVYPIDGFKDVFSVMGAGESDGTRRIQIFLDADKSSIQEYLMLS